MPAPTAHLVQLNSAWEDKAANFEKVRQLLDRVEVAAGDFVLLPEMFDTGFSFSVELTADMNAATLAFLAELAQDLGVVVQGGRTVAPCHKCAAKNMMTVLAPGEREAKLVTEYAKIHPFPTERDRFEGGTDVVQYEWAGLRVCPAICYDLRFPELFRIGLARGAEMFALGACWPEVRQHHWRALLIARAIENQAFVLGCNRVGVEPGVLGQAITYSGGSIVVSPKGDVLGELADAEGVLSVPIDAEQVHAWRRTFRAWRDVRLMGGVSEGERVTR